MRLSALLLILVVCGILVLTPPASACNYGAARLFLAPQTSYGYSYAQPAPVLAPALAPSCDCAPAAAPALLPAPSYTPSYSPSCAPAASAAPGYSYAPQPVLAPSYGVIRQRSISYSRDVGFVPAPVYYGGGTVLRQRSFGGFYAPSANVTVIRQRGFARPRGVVVANDVGFVGDTAVAVRGANVVAAPGAQVEVRRGLFGATRVRVR